MLPNKMTAYLAVVRPTTKAEDAAWADKAREMGVSDEAIQNTLAGREYDRSTASEMPTFVGRLVSGSSPAGPVVKDSRRSKHERTVRAFQASKRISIL